MAELDVVMRDLLHHLGVTLHPRGFHSSGAVWRLIRPEGVAVIHKQPSERSRPDARMFYIDTAVAPKVSHPGLDILQPGRYLAELNALPDKRIGHWPPLVILLSGRGPSPELDAACAKLREAFAERPRAAGYVDELIGWAHARASSCFAYVAALHNTVTGTPPGCPVL